MTNMKSHWSKIKVHITVN